MCIYYAFIQGIIIVKMIMAHFFLNFSYVPFCSLFLNFFFPYDIYQRGVSGKFNVLTIKWNSKSLHKLEPQTFSLQAKVGVLTSKGSSKSLYRLTQTHTFSLETRSTTRWAEGTTNYSIHVILFIIPLSSLVPSILVLNSPYPIPPINNQSYKP